MSVLFSEKITAVSSRPERPKLGGHIERLLAAADVNIPDRGTIPLAQVDKALIGQTVSERLYIKSVMRERGYLA